jgi:hypothetical protein
LRVIRQRQRWKAVGLHPDNGQVERPVRGVDRFHGQRFAVGCGDRNWPGFANDMEIRGDEARLVDDKARSQSVLPAVAAGEADYNDRGADLIDQPRNRSRGGLALRREAARSNCQCEGQ